MTTYRVYHCSARERIEGKRGTLLIEWECASGREAIEEWQRARVGERAGFGLRREPGPIEAIRRAYWAPGNYPGKLDRASLVAMRVIRRRAVA